MLNRLSRIGSHPWLAKTHAAIGACRARVDGWLRAVDTGERKRLGTHAVALGTVATAAVLQSVVGFPAGTPFWMLHAAIAVAAAAGGAQSAGVAALASLLAARLMGAVPLGAGLLFLLEAALVAVVVLRLKASIGRERQRMSAVESWLLELKSSERQGRLIDVAFGRLDEVAAETVLLVLDSSGRIADWRAGAARIYGRPAAEVLGSKASVLFEDLSDEEFARLVADARQGTARHAGGQRRGDGSVFDAEVDIQPLSRGGFDGFTMIVRDLTRQRAGEAAATSTARAYAQLREEADFAHQQLSTLRYITDPSLNSLSGGEFLTTLLGRLRTSINAEGIALVHIGRFRRRVFCAAGGLQCQRGIHRPPVELRGADAGRTLMIHNDPAGVAELSAAGWPDGVSSLMAVPVVRAGSVQAVMEVVNRTGRRATEWEIALVQVGAARVAGFLQDDPYADSGAVA